MSKTMRTALAGATVLAVGAPVAATVSTPIAATAATSQTYVYTNGMGALWSGAQVRPGRIVFGAQYEMRRLRWFTWRSLDATGRGHFSEGSCIDAPCYSYNAHVKLYYVKVHNGRKYFAWIRITATGHRTRQLQFSGGRWHTR